MMGETFLSIIIPAFNEADTIEKNILEIESYMLHNLSDCAWEMIVVNDGSTDKMLEVLNRLKESKEWLKVVDLIFHYGRGKALRAGLAEARGDIIVTIDADLSYAPYHIQRMIDKIKTENADIVLASAYGKDGTVKNVPLRRLWLSWFGNKVLSYMFGGGISVLTCLVRAYKTEFIRRLDLHSDDKEIHLEILSKAKMIGGKIVEVPADLYWREEKLDKGRAKRRSTMKMRRTSSSHLFFALMNNPGIIFWVPAYFLLSIALIIFFLSAGNIVIDIWNGKSFYSAVRSSMLTAVPSWLTFVATFILGFQFLTLGFITNQSKKNHEEVYKTLNSIYTEIKRKEG